MIIDNIEYEDTYKKTHIFHENTKSKDKKCFICDKEFKAIETHFEETGIYIENLKDSLDYHKFFPLCIKCGKSPKKAEEMMIILLKIMFGGKIRIDRKIKYSSDVKNKDFYY